MSRVRTALFAAILVALTVIGWQLHRIADALSPSPLASASSFTVPGAQGETRAQRDARIQRETAAALEDAATILRTPYKPTPTPAKNTPEHVR